MKRKVIRAPPVHKILEEQSSKLKEKLELLKQQIQQKKKQKEGGKQTNQTESTTSKSKVSATSNLDNSELVELLASLHMENLINKLREKNVNTFQDFKSLQPEAIDQWKDIAVGYRIKLKKHLNGGRIGLSPSPQRKISLEKPKNIEEIVKCRQKERIYVPLTIQSEEQYINEELSEHQQERMIQNLMSAFNTTNQIQEIQLKPSSKPTIVIQSKQAWGVGRSIFPEFQYCWSCLKMLQNTVQQYKNRSFCSQNCIEKYKQVLQVQEDNQFFEKIQKTEIQFSKYLQNRNTSGPSKRVNRAIEPKQDQEIDFDIL